MPVINRFLVPATCRVFFALNTSEGGSS
ncbi:hypothetical protein [Bradyrhizobium sp. BWA-3-5]